MEVFRLRTVYLWQPLAERDISGGSLTIYPSFGTFSQPFIPRAIARPRQRAVIRVLFSTAIYSPTLMLFPADPYQLWGDANTTTLVRMLDQQWPPLVKWPQREGFEILLGYLRSVLRVSLTRSLTTQTGYSFISSLAS